MKKSNRKNLVSFCDLRMVLLIFIISTFLLNGCATTWENKGSFYQTIQTDLVINSVPEGMVYIDNKYVGKTPFATPVKYEQKVNKKSRKASYWETQPGLSLLLTITSLGLYLPFSFIPVDIETSLDPVDSFRKNEITVSISAKGYTSWEDKVILNGQKNISLKPTLEGLDK